jgi:purine-cytosine permease-like protein
METIITLIAIGYAIGFVIIAYFGIVGANEVVDYHNNKKKG